MARKVSRDPEKENYWRRQVARQAGSALSIRRYCRRQNLSESLFHWWKRELAARDRQRQTPPASGRAPTGFTEIMLSGPPSPVLGRTSSPAPASAPPTLLFPGAIEIVLGGGRAIRVGAGFDGQTLSRVPAVLEGTGPC